MTPVRLPLVVAAIAALVAMSPRSAAAQSPQPADPPALVVEGIVDAPADEVWKVWTTSEGYRKLGPELADVDFRVGGLIRSKYRAVGTLDDEDAIVNRIMAYEPKRMIAIQIARPPAKFPFKDAWKSMWTVVSLTPEGPGRTHVRVASLGFGADEESQQMRAFFERGNAATIEVLQAAFKR
jgi:uncharacterized protein YndB with AHSA1/START domain